MDFIRRHKNKFLLAGGAAGALIIVNKVLSNYEKQWQTSQSRGFVHEARKKEIHFENIINECNTICAELSLEVLKNLDRSLDDTVLIEKLSQTRDGKAVNEKVKTWNDLKVRIFTRLLSEVYSICILVCYSRVQMSVIGGQMYCASMAQQNTATIGSSSNGNNDVVNMKAYTKYVSLLSNMYRERLEKLIPPIQETVEDVTRDYNLEYKISLQDFNNIFDKIKRSMGFTLSGSDSKTRLFSLDLGKLHKTDDLGAASASTLGGKLAPQEEEALRSMLSETQEIFESDDFQHVLDSSIEIGYSTIVDLIVGAFVKHEKKLNASKQDGFSNPNSIQVPFVKILPEIRSSMRDRTDADRRGLVNHLLCIDVLNCFAANVYEAFCSPANS